MIPVPLPIFYDSSPYVRFRHQSVFDCDLLGEMPLIFLGFFRFYECFDDIARLFPSYFGP